MVSSIKLSFHRSVSIASFLILSFLFMIYLNYQTDYYHNKFLRYYIHGNESGILGFASYDINIVYYLISNMVLYYIPFTSKMFYTSLFGQYMLIYLLANIYIFYKILFKYQLRINSNDKLLNFAAINILLYFPIAANEATVSAAIRHGIYMLPFIYIYFGIYKRKVKLNKIRKNYGNNFCTES